MTAPHVSPAPCLRRVSTVVLLGVLAGTSLGQNAFTNFEAPPVHPVELTPDGTRLLVANTADDRVEIFDLTSGWPVHTGSIPVGTSPTAVRARTNDEVWVVNHVSDNVSIVSLPAMNVMASVTVGDEPCDVVFAGAPARAFVSVSQRNLVRVLDPLNPLGPQLTVNIEGEDPRALATDGTRVFAAIFEGGNRTTIIPREVVSNPASPYGGQNPPPNDGAAFFPPIAPGLGPTPPVALIVKKVGGAWMDDNGRDWSAFVNWDLHDHDAAIIDANTLATSYVSGLMTLNMALGVNPATGMVTVVGTEATNHIRFEPVLSGTFVRVHAAEFDPASPASSLVTDLNPHLTYATSTIPQAQRDLSIGDPRGIVWNSTGTRAYVTGMGSNNLLVLDAALSRLARLDLGRGPTGIALDAPRGRAYVLNRFDATVSVIDTGANTELGRVAFFDPTTPAIRLGRPFLYDTRRTSGLGQVACASCHIDGRMDQLSWDLGDPSGSVASLSQACASGLPPPPFQGQPCQPYHPMKGPMATQTLQGIVGNGVMHWRGDRPNLAAFNVAFVGLQGDDAPPTPAEMQLFTDMVATLRFPPNPNRNLNDTLPASVPGFTGNPVNGGGVFGAPNTVGGVRSCVVCHAGPTLGTNRAIMPANFIGEQQTFKVPHLRNLYEKAGFNRGTLNGGLGFGMLHDGSDESVFQYLSTNPVFTFPPGPPGQQQRRDLEAFLMCFDTGTHPVVGAQITVDGLNNNLASTINFLNTLQAAADAGTPGGPPPNPNAPTSIIAKGVFAGQLRGFAYIGNGNFQSDIAGQVVTLTQLRTAPTPGNPITFTGVMRGSEIRMGIDRDADGFFDRDELNACSDPADANIVPGGPGSGLEGDANHDLSVGLGDVALIIQFWGQSVPPFTSGDVTGDGFPGLDDVALVLLNWGRTCP